MLHSIANEMALNPIRTGLFFDLCRPWWGVVLIRGPLRYSKTIKATTQGWGRDRAWDHETMLSQLAKRCFHKAFSVAREILQRATVTKGHNNATEITLLLY